MTVLDSPEANKSGAKAFTAGAALGAFLFLECLVALQAWLAYRDQFLTVAQMQGKGIHLGLPFAWHFGMWGDLFIVSPLAAYVVGCYSSTWRLRWVLLSLAFGVAAAIILGWSYTLPDIQEAHAQNHSLTPTGVVHLVYTALVLAVFTQFFFFTENISPQLLRIASVLLIAHVFFGTHMALGLLNLFYSFDWYPAEPLKSVIGWGIVLTVVVGLIWRNVGNAGMYSAVVFVYMFLTSEDPRPLEGHLKLLNRVSDLSISITYLFQLFRIGLESGRDRLSLVLLLLIAIKYFFSRVSVKQELEIGKTLYPPGNIPDDLLPKTRFEITVRVVGFLVLDAVPGSVSNHIFWASLILTIIACNDYRTRDDISSNVLRTFDDPKYLPSEGEKNYQSIMEKRKVARWYLSDLPTREKEGLHAIGCFAAWCMTMYGYYFSDTNFDFAAYTTLIFTLAFNELVTLWWRIGRFRRLLAIDRSVSTLRNPGYTSAPALKL